MNTLTTILLQIHRVENENPLMMWIQYIIFALFTIVYVFIIPITLIDIIIHPQKYKNMRLKEKIHEIFRLSFDF